MPPWEKTGVPGDVALAHFHSSTISGSASCTIWRTFANVFPRQSPSSLILSSIMRRQIPPEWAFSYTAPTLAPILSRAQSNLHPPQVEASFDSIAGKDGGNPRAGLIGMIGIMLNA